MLRSIATSLLYSSRSKSNVPRAMGSCISTTTSNVAAADSTPGDESLENNAKKRALGPSESLGDETEAKVCGLDPSVWSKLPEEMLLLIFARLPVKSIVVMRSLSKSWRSTILSPQFQQAFSEVSLLRVSLLFVFDHHIMICCRPQDERHAENVIEQTHVIAGTASGLICVLTYSEDETRLTRQGLRVRDLKVFVTNVVTGIRRQLPSPRITTKTPTLVQMKANVNGGYTITFIHTQCPEGRDQRQASSWQVYDSVTNKWSQGEERDFANFNDAEVFNKCYAGLFDVRYDDRATFYKETKAIRELNVHGGEERNLLCEYPSARNEQFHCVTGKLYKLCMQEWPYCFFHLVFSSKQKTVHEWRDDEGRSYSFRMLNDFFGLIIKAPTPFKIAEWYDRVQKVDLQHGGGPVEGSNQMNTKVWYSISEEEHRNSPDSYTYEDCQFDAHPFPVEIRFDAIP